jgi:hypothetical protein
VSLPDAAVAAVITGAVGLVSTGITQLASSVHRRTHHVQAVNDAKADVEFWQQWLKAEELAQTPDGLERARETARGELDRVYLAVIARKQELGVASPQDAPRGRAERSWFKRALLLYLPVRGAAWVPRVSFWAILVLCVIGVIGAYGDPDEGEMAIVSAGYAVLGAAAFILAVGLPLRAWSVWLDRHPRSRVPMRL